MAGREADRDRLADLFQVGRFTVHRDPNGEHYLAAPQLDAAWGDGVGMAEAATLVLQRANGIATVRYPSFIPVRLANRFSDETDAHHHVVAVDSVVCTVEAGTPTILINGVPQMPSPPPATHYDDLAHAHPDVADVLALLATGDQGFVTTYKVFEIVRQSAGGHKALKATGWVAPDDVDAFWVSANDPAISGPAARHARGIHNQAPHAMTEREGAEFVRTMVQRWLESF